MRHTLRLLVLPRHKSGLTDTLAVADSVVGAHFFIIRHAGCCWLRATCILPKLAALSAAASRLEKHSKMRHKERAGVRLVR